MDKSNLCDRHGAMQPTPYADLNFVPGEFVTRVRKVLIDNVIGVYLQGSFGVGDFDIYSDVDFLIILEDDCSRPSAAGPSGLARGNLRPGFDVGAAPRRLIYS
jgi:Nucleotidyltransferase domain